MQTEPSTLFTQERREGRGAQPCLRFTMFAGTADEYIETQALDAGGINRGVAWDTGKFSPGSMNFSVDSKDGHLVDSIVGSKLNRKRYLNSVVKVEVGFVLPSGSVEYLPAFEGYLQNKILDRGRLKASFNAYDVFKILLDKTIARKFLASAVFSYTDTTIDYRQIQTCIKYGSHQLLNPREAFERNGALYLTECMPCEANGYGTGETATPHPRGRLWFVPVLNSIDVNKIYIWDYRTTPAGGKNRWLEITSGATIITAASGRKYLDLAASVGTPAGSITIAGYMNGTFDSSTTDTLDAVIAISHEPPAGNVEYYRNPVSIIFDLLANTDFGAGLPTSMLDYSSFATPDLNRNFDKSYNTLKDIQYRMLTNFRAPVNILEAIETISLGSNLTFICTQNDSTSLDRRIKLIEDEPRQNASTPELFSPDVQISSMNLKKTNDRLVNKINGVSLYYGVDTRKEFHSIQVQDAASVAQYGEKLLDLTPSNLDADVVAYDSQVALQNFAQRVLVRLSEPEEVVEVDCDFYGLPFQLKDIVQIKDTLLNLNDNYQVKSTRLELQNFRIIMELSKFGSLFGPDTLNPHKHWGFADDAFADDSDGTDYLGRLGTSGTGASGTATTKILTFATALPSSLEVGMLVSIDVGGATEETLEVASIDSTTQITVKDAMAFTHTAAVFSIGEAFYAY